MTLFPNATSDNLMPYDGTVNDFGLVLDVDAAQYWFNCLLHSIAWQHDEVMMRGKRITTARQVAWYGDAPYYYSGVLKRPLPWTAALLTLKALVERHTEQHFNSCLLNLYADGSQGLAWHSDDEPALGAEPAIASLSLGASRRFCWQHKRSGQRLELNLAAGQLLLMHGSVQRHWRHAIPKMLKVKQARISLTFRSINIA